jgi:hypothetical protein
VSEQPDEVPTDAYDFILRYGFPKKGQSIPVFLPTKHRPGTPEKVKVLRYRVANGLPLWHEKDAPIDLS